MSTRYLSKASIKTLLFFMLVGSLAVAQAKDAVVISANGTVNWSSGSVVVNGYGATPVGKEGSGLGKLHARRAAVVEAYRNLTELVHGVRVTSSSSVKDMTEKSHTIKTSIDNLIKGALITDEEYLEGVYRIQLTMQMSSRFVGAVHDKAAHSGLGASTKLQQLNGMIESVFGFFLKSAYADLPILSGVSIRNHQQYQFAKQMLRGFKENPSITVKSIEDEVALYETNEKITGLIVDASTVVDFEMATVPGIRNEQGELLYPNELTNYADILKKRPASYDFSVSDALMNKRVASAPLVVASSGVYKSKRSDLVVSDEYSDVIRRLNLSGAVNQAKVIIVVAE